MRLIDEDHHTGGKSQQKRFHRFCAYNSSLNSRHLKSALLTVAWNASLVNRMESLHAIHTLEHAEEIGLGSRTYELVNIDD